MYVMCLFLIVGHASPVLAAALGGHFRIMDLLLQHCDKAKVCVR
jgi:hypothetical protein